MASILGKLFGGLVGGGDGGAPAEGKRGEAVEYEGYTIQPAPRKQGGQWLTAGVISKQVGDELKEHHFLRADTHANVEDAESFSVTKAKQIIDEQKDAIFR